MFIFLSLFFIYYFFFQDDAVKLRHYAIMDLYPTEASLEVN